MTDKYLNLKTGDKNKKVLIVTSQIVAIKQTGDSTMTIYTRGGASFDITSDFEWFEKLFASLYPEEQKS